MQNSDDNQVIKYLKWLTMIFYYLRMKIETMHAGSIPLFSQLAQLHQSAKGDRDLVK